jgi:hypothetical protein
MKINNKKIWTETIHQIFISSQRQLLFNKMSGILFIVYGKPMPNQDTYGVSLDILILLNYTKLN